MGDEVRKSNVEVSVSKSSLLLQTGGHSAWEIVEEWEGGGHAHTQVTQEKKIRKMGPPRTILVLRSKVRIRKVSQKQVDFNHS